MQDIKNRDSSQENIEITEKLKGTRSKVVVEELCSSEKEAKKQVSSNALNESCSKIFVACKMKEPTTSEQQRRIVLISVTAVILAGSLVAADLGFLARQMKSNKDKMQNKVAESTRSTSPDLDRFEFNAQPDNLTLTLVDGEVVVVQLNGIEALTKRHPTLNLAAVTFGDKIGEGTFASIYKASARGRTYAVKSMHSDVSELNLRKAQLSARNELYYALRAIQHENIVQSFQAWWEQGGLHLLMEYVDLSLADITARCGSLAEDVLALISYQLLQGLQALRQSGIIHLDINAENILIGLDGCVKLCDFGMIRVFPPFGKDSTLKPPLPTSNDYKNWDTCSMGLMLVHCSAGVQRHMIMFLLDGAGGVNFDLVEERYFRSKGLKEPTSIFKDFIGQSVALLDCNDLAKHVFISNVCTNSKSSSRGLEDWMKAALYAPPRSATPANAQTSIPASPVTPQTGIPRKISTDTLTEPQMLFSTSTPTPSALHFPPRTINIGTNPFHSVSARSTNVAITTATYYPSPTYATGPYLTPAGPPTINYPTTSPTFSHSKNCTTTLHKPCVTTPQHKPLITTPHVQPPEPPPSGEKKGKIKCRHCNGPHFSRACPTGPPSSPVLPPSSPVTTNTKSTPPPTNSGPSLYLKPHLLPYATVPSEVQSQYKSNNPNPSMLPIANPLGRSPHLQPPIAKIL